jgi:predicted amidohydrolase
MLRAAVVQTNATGDIARNTERAADLIRQAAADGATFIQTPEVTNMIPATGDDLFRLIRDEAEDETLAALQALAAELHITLHVGSLALKSEDPERAANRGFLIGPDGGIITRYDKIHMFEADLGEKGKYREAARYRPGETAVLANAAGTQIGMGICYDMRFPGLFRDLAQAGAEVLTAPSAFTVPTGKAHWHVLLRARAIENGCFMLAAAQWGPHGGKDESAMRESYGHSLIVDPWGRVLADAGEGEGIAVADLDLSLVAQARKRIGSLTQGREAPVERA